jgi:hypothetical protein
MNFGNPFETGDDRRNVYLALDKLFCGCGNPEEAVALVHALLRAAPFYESRERLSELLPTTGIEMLVLGALDETAELIEHGSSIGGSWLTPRGEEALRGLDLIEANEGYRAFVGEDRCAHGTTMDEPCPDCENWKPASVPEGSRDG